jgi:Trk K+ transport system NAD-binding subunit
LTRRLERQEPADGAGDLIEAEVLETAPIVGKAIKELGLSDGVRFSAILPNAPFVAPKGFTEFGHNDRAILFTPADRVCGRADVARELGSFLARRHDQTSSRQ